MSNRDFHRSRDLREQRFRAAADEIIRSNRKIRDHIQSVRDFYLGNPDAPVPPVKSRLETVLERRPITPSVSAISRAHQCWNEHRKEWDAAAKNGTGYSVYQSLARAI